LSYKRGRKAIILKQYLKLSSFLYLTKKEKKKRNTSFRKKIEGLKAKRETILIQ